jgi:hypothetical protein
VLVADGRPLQRLRDPQHHLGVTDVDHLHDWFGFGA